MGTEKVFLIIHQLGFSFFALGGILLFALALSCYVKLVTVLGIVRVGLGAEGIPSMFVGGVLALALSALVMYPTVTRSLSAIDQKMAQHGAPTDESRVSALAAGVEQWKSFVSKHVDPREVERFSRLASEIEGKPIEEGRTEGSVGESSWQVLAPAFLVSEMKSAFRIGFSVFLPLLLIDLLVANLLLAVGFEQVSPHLVSFPLKLALFVMVDGWSLITANLVSSYVI